MHGGHDRHVTSLRCQRLHQGTEYGFLFQQVVAVQGEQEIVALAQSEAGEPERLYKAVAVVADGVDEDIAYVVDILRYHTLLVEVAIFI